MATEPKKVIRRVVHGPKPKSPWTTEQVEAARLKVETRENADAQAAKARGLQANKEQGYQ